MDACKTVNIKKTPDLNDFNISVHTIVFILSYYKPFNIEMCSVCHCHLEVF